jgi:hypothetical protein
MINDDFENGIGSNWVRFCIGHSNIETEKGVARFVLDGAEVGQLSDAEIDDHRTVPRDRLLWKPPLRLNIRARMSHPYGELLGTAGFGFWNDPFDWVGNVQVPPNALWFFYASPQSAMSFDSSARGHGWKAATLNAGHADPLTMTVGNFVFQLPGMSRLVFAAAQTRIHAHEKNLDDVDLTEWHDYQIDWQADLARFSVDGADVLVAPKPPRMALGFVAWIDNNAAAMGPGREFAFNRIAVGQRQWMELARVRISNL